MQLTSIRELPIDELKDLYSAETQLVKALPRIAKHVSSESLKDTIESHLEETRDQVARLERVAELLGQKKLTGRKCKGMEGLLKEGKHALEVKGDDTIIDAAIVASAQRVEHYEIAAYGAVRTIAELLGENEVVNLLQQTLDEEKAADRKLTDVVEHDIYPQVRNGHVGNGEMPTRREERGVTAGVAM